MNLLTIVIVIFIALIHAYFMYLEMVLWTTKKGIKTFNLKTYEFAISTKVLAANQGLYNGFLAAGILFSLYHSSTKFLLFYLTCIVIAGLFGSYSTKNRRIIIIQSLPAFIAILLLLL